MRSEYPFPGKQAEAVKLTDARAGKAYDTAVRFGKLQRQRCRLFPTESGMTRVEYSPVKLFSASTVSSNCAGIPDEETVSVHVICSPRPTVSGAESVSVICRGSSSDTADSSGSAAASSTQSVPALFANRYRPSAPASRMPQRTLRPAILKMPRPASQLPVEAPA